MIICWRVRDGDRSLCAKTRRWDLVESEWLLLAGSVIRAAATGAKGVTSQRPVSGSENRNVRQYWKAGLEAL